MKRSYAEHGYTEGCEGCARLAAGMKPRPHSNACRGRMYRELKKTEEGRKWMEESEARANDYLEEKLRKDDGSKDEEKKESQGEADEKKSAQDDVASPAGLSSSGAAAGDASVERGDRRRWDRFPKGGRARKGED